MPGPPGKIVEAVEADNLTSEERAAKAAVRGASRSSAVSTPRAGPRVRYRSKSRRGDHEVRRHRGIPGEANTGHAAEPMPVSPSLAASLRVPKPDIAGVTRGRRDLTSEECGQRAAYFSPPPALSPLIVVLAAEPARKSVVAPGVTARDAYSVGARRIARPPCGWLCSATTNSV